MQSRSFSVRLLLAVTGAVLFVVYLAVGAAVVELLTTVATTSLHPLVFLASLLVCSLLFGYVSYRGGTAAILGSLDAWELPRDRAPQLYARVDRLCDRMQVESPTLLVAQMPAPNALAIGGRDGGTVVLSTSLFRLLTLDELETIVAHELAHIESRDSLVQTLGLSLAETVGGVIFLFLLPVGLFVAGIRRSLRWMTGRRTESFASHLRRTHAQVATVVFGLLFVVTLALRAHSRRRELAADDRAASVTGKPITLARALARIERASKPPGGLLSPLYIHGEEESALGQLLATHPPMTDRIQRLVDRAEASWTTIEIE
ncbi:M48 family metallopeptidase [Haloarchaeobius sp. TZWWS8]|uniref:M48 family metallopeptidase n=1 Tax=Haloarchaeobius sp. TZWWS8 TaxID=3446121 RepID=UPI003EBC0BBF